LAKERGGGFSVAEQRIRGVLAVRFEERRQLWAKSYNPPSMSNLLERESICPACQQPVMVEVWSAINVREDPELKDLLLGGELNVVECSSCKEPFPVDAFMLYHDPDNEIMAFVFPLDEDLDLELLKEKTSLDFDTSQATLAPADRLTYRPICMKGLDELVRFVEHDDEVALQGDVVAAIAKESKIPVRRLKPWKARQENLPRVLPVIEAPGKNLRDAALAGLRRLHELNNLLTVYNQTLERLSSDVSASVDLS
jgi:hypothetical protein